MTRSTSAILMAAALGALGACSSDNLPATATTAPVAPASTTTTVVTTQPAVPGTLVTPPGTVAVPSYGSSTTTQTVTTTSASPRLSSLDVMNLLNGSTASGTAANGNPYYAHFQRSGSVDLHEQNATVAVGTWHVTDDGQLCSSFANVNAGAQQCYTIYRNGNGPNYVYERPDGHPVGSFVVQPGA